MVHMWKFTDHVNSDHKSLFTIVSSKQSLIFISFNFIIRPELYGHPLFLQLINLYTSVVLAVKRYVFPADLKNVVSKMLLIPRC